MAELAQHFHQPLRAEPFLFRRLLRLFSALAELRFVKERRFYPLTFLLCWFLRAIALV